MISLLIFMRYGMLSKKQEFLLQKVQKPARYIGGEVNSVVKDKSKIKFRYAFCFPDNYEIARLCSLGGYGRGDENEQCSSVRS